MRWRNWRIQANVTPMRRYAFLLIILSTGGCAPGDRTPASAYKNWDDRLSVALGLPGTILRWPCTRKVAGVLESLPPDECYRMTTPRRFKGIWVDEFEGSRFVENAQSLNGVSWYDPATWLDPVRDPALENEDGRLRVHEVEFMGQKTIVPGSYGHMGGSEHMVVMNRLIAAREIDASPWQKQLDAFRERVRREDEARRATTR